MLKSIGRFLIKTILICLIVKISLFPMCFSQSAKWAFELEDITEFHNDIQEHPWPIRTYQQEWIDNIAYNPDLPETPIYWLPHEIIVQNWNGQWENHSRYKFYDNFDHGTLGVPRYIWRNTENDWSPQSVLNLIWVDGNISQMYITEVATGNTLWTCYYTGPYQRGVPTKAAWWWRLDDALKHQMDVITSFDSNDNPISRIYSLYVEQTLTDMYKVETSYSSDQPCCPDAQIFSENIGGIWTEQFFADHFTCYGDAGLTLSLISPNECQETYKEIRDADGNVVHTVGLDIVGGNAFTFWFNSTPTRAELTYKQVGTGKTNKIHDDTGYRLVKIESQISEDGTNWANDKRIWISYDDLQMDTDVSNTTPVSFELHQNYPNPFNPTTTITFTLIEESNVNIKIYNSLGIEIITIVNEHMNIGSHEIVWDGLDKSGVKVSGGTYFVQLKVDHYTETKKMLLMK